MTWYTDYPIICFGDTPGQKAPKRKVNIVSFERDPYVLVDVFDPDTEKVCRESIKSFYVYAEINEK